LKNYQRSQGTQGHVYLPLGKR